MKFSDEREFPQELVIVRDAATGQLHVADYDMFEEGAETAKDLYGLKPGETFVVAAYTLRTTGRFGKKKPS